VQSLGIVGNQVYGWSLELCVVFHFFRRDVRTQRSSDLQCKPTYVDKSEGECSDIFVKRFRMFSYLFLYNVVCCSQLDVYIPK
jgi:hypothetical protein